LTQRELLIDFTDLSRRLQGDRDLICQALQAVAEDLPRCTEEMVQNIAVQNHDSLFRNCHRLKNHAALISCAPLLDALETFKKTWNGEDGEKIKTQLDKLRLFQTEVVSEIEMLRCQIMATSSLSQIR